MPEFCDLISASPVYQSRVSRVEMLVLSYRPALPQNTSIPTLFVERPEADSLKTKESGERKTAYFDRKVPRNVVPTFAAKNRAEMLRTCTQVSNLKCHQTHVIVTEKNFRELLLSLRYVDKKQQIY